MKINNFSEDKKYLESNAKDTSVYNKYSKYDEDEDDYDEDEDDYDDYSENKNFSPELIKEAELLDIVVDDDLYKLTIKDINDLDDDSFDIESLYPVTKPKEMLTFAEKTKYAEENIALIHFVIKSLNATKIAYDELFSVGNVGYAKALESYDKSRNVKFATYAINCIRNEILFFLRKENKVMQNTTSLNQILSTDKNGNSLSLEETISFDNINDKSLEDIILDDENRRVLIKVLKYLKPEEQYIIVYRFGLDKGIIKTQKEIADAIKMSQANVSKIQKNCLSKLKLLLRKDILC